MTPRRGEVWLVDLGMAQKTRPPLVLSVGGYADEDRVLITVASHTTSLRGSEWEVAVDVPFLKQGAFLVQSITTIPARHALRRIGTLLPPPNSRPSRTACGVGSVCEPGDLTGRWTSPACAR